MKIAIPDRMVDGGAWTEYGKRVISWKIPEPGEWHRNRYTYAWIDVTEREPWRGEPLWLTATRRTSDGAMRESFTDKARKAIAAEVIPTVARYGFTRLWLELHRTKDDGARCLQRADEARREVEWWRQRADLLEYHAAGLVEFVPIRHDMTQREQRVRVVPEFHGQAHTESVACRAMMDGEQVGWMTPTGSLIPMGDVLGT